jgi:hypothetical protein
VAAYSIAVPLWISCFVLLRKGFRGSWVAGNLGLLEKSLNLKIRTFEIESFILAILCSGGKRREASELSLVNV